MRYMLLIYTDPQVAATEGADMQAWMDYTNALVESGAMLGGDPLQGPETATTVRVRNGDRLVTDGPFAETKEHLLGFYMVDCADLDAALGWAARIPSAPYGSVEVRPIQELGGIEG